jgi:predicted N-acetyltransferase YhbS
VGIFPFTAVVEGRKLKVAGIGGVATHPDFRNQGLKNRLMEHVQNQIDAEGYDLSILWGHTLYRSYGYEWALPKERFTFTKRFLKAPGVKEGVRPARSGDWKRLLELYLRHPFRCERSVEYFRSIQRSFQGGLPNPVWVLENFGKVAAYVIVFKLGPQELEVAEWGGEAGNVSRLLVEVFRNRPQKDLQVSLYDGCDLLDWARENADDQVRTTEYCMVKVLNLPRVLKAFEPQLQRRYEELGFKSRRSYTLQLEDGQAVTVALGRKLQVLQGKKGDIPIPLNSIECVRLLLGQGQPTDWLRSKGPEIKFLDFLFPLRWFWWRSEWI